MRSKSSKTIATVGFALLSAASAHAADAVSAQIVDAASSNTAGADSFNRPKLGATWKKVAGKLSISNAELVGTNEALGYSTDLSQATGASVVMFLGSTDLEYGAIALGDIAHGSNAFVKLQDESGNGEFDTAGFYTGNNDSTNGTFFELSSPVPSPALVDVSFCGTVATLRITSSSGVQTYSFDYGTAYTGGGLGTVGAVAMDNVVGFKSSCADAPGPNSPGTRRAVDLRRAVDKSLSK